jgi:hypothetical protein
MPKGLEPRKTIPTADLLAELNRQMASTDLIPVRRALRAVGMHVLLEARLPVGHVVDVRVTDDGEVRAARGKVTQPPTDPSWVAAYFPDAPNWRVVLRSAHGEIEGISRREQVAS